MPFGRVQRPAQVRAAGGLAYDGAGRQAIQFGQQQPAGPDELAGLHHAPAAPVMGPHLPLDAFARVIVREGQLRVAVQRVGRRPDLEGRD